MANIANSSQTLEVISSVIERTRGDSDSFAETLRHQGIPHISYSQITTVEFCPYRYLLQYVKLQDLTPIPDYFTKGKLLHQIIALSYEKMALGQALPTPECIELLERQYQGDSQRHLRNALEVHLENRWQGCQIIAVEKPFAMTIDPTLPPCVGVVDLILKKDGRFILIDHKTGHDFYPQDELQMAIYVHYIRQTYGEVPCEFYYDHYRWVNNLGRIRKPAFQRTGVTDTRLAWSAALERIRAGWAAIERIRQRNWAPKTGQCFRCPYRKACFR